MEALTVLASRGSASLLSHSLLLAELAETPLVLFLEAVVVLVVFLLRAAVGTSGLFHVYIVKSEARLEYSMFCFRGALSQARTSVY